jgi:hypothetical protein
MKRNLPLVFGLACASAFAAMLAQFSDLSATVTASGLRVSFTASGLPQNTADTINATANATAVWGCFNRGGHNPNSKNKRTTVTRQVTGSASFTSNANGVIVGAVNLRAPGAGSFSCPNGQDKMLSSVNFTNVRISDTIAGISASVPGTFEKVLHSMG